MNAEVVLHLAVKYADDTCFCYV